MLYQILSADIPHAESILKKLERKANKYGVPFSYSFGDEKIIKARFLTPHGTYQYTPAKVREVRVEAEKISVSSEWEAVAMLEHRQEGNLVSMFSDEESRMEYYSMDCNCEHCRTNRYRKFTFIVKNKGDNTTRQVGKTCLKEYTGIDPELALLFLDFNGTFAPLNFQTRVSDEFYHGAYRQIFRVKEILAIASESISERGYIPTSEQGSTKSYILDRVGTDYPISAENLKKAEEVIQWVLDSDDTSDFMCNAKTLCREKYCESKDVGRLAYLPAGFDKFTRKREWEAQRNAEREQMGKASDFVGKEKERLTISIESCQLLTSGESYYGYWYLYQFLDTDGNVFVWFASNPLDDLENRKILAIKGTVKKHDERNGVKQTVLTRVKVDKEEKIQ